MDRTSRLTRTFVAAAFALTAAPSFAAEPAGKAVGVVGKVLVRNLDSSKPEMRFMKVGDPVERGTLINTGSGASVKLMLKDKTILDLGGSTLFKVDEFLLKNGNNRNVQMSMDYGKVRASVNTPVGAAGRFSIKTQAATMGVRGTEFIVASTLPVEPAAPKGSSSQGGSGKAAPSQTQVTVVHGKVEVATPAPAKETGAKPQAPIALTSGTQLTAVAPVTPAAGEAVNSAAAAPVEAPKVVKVTMEELKAIKAEVKAPDNQAFIQAVAFTPSDGSSSSSSGSGGSSNGGPSSGGARDSGGAPQGGGMATLAAIVDTIKIDSNAIPTGVPLGVPGAFRPEDSVKNPNTNLMAIPAVVRVVFRKN